MEAVLGLIQNSPHDDPQSAKLQEDMDKLRAKFRQVLDLLEICNSEGCPSSIIRIRADQGICVEWVAAAVTHCVLHGNTGSVS